MIKFPEKINSIEAKQAWLVENKQFVLDKKKSEVKKSDPVSGVGIDFQANKQMQVPGRPVEKIRVRAVVNTTRILDSMGDVHIDQLWNKSLKESRQHYLIREHKLDFDNIISDDVHVFVKQIPWVEIGYNYPGTTQALIYDAVITKEGSAGMFDKYLNGKVKNHSVGMRYIKVLLAINDPQYPDEYKVWEKYFPEIVNQSDAEQLGYFFAVTEAKNIEGSAVVIGANPATPTLFVEAKSEPPGTQNQPEISTVELVKSYYRPVVKF